ncbi:coniferyl aldehyde dehydrogenase [Rubrivivax albus]|uniref:Aldehyde dehydrogenase n=1 Tax=Rubrivivax albus TaxID=2499835 RepID=A0A437JNL7_9BURK|nr:coniferyl aldehyde dehydrogenase [Rubrivivax albus]RVT48420.1 coniferyl aldehyde dehydrogenase [Rubrivivax albus]
MNPTDLPLTERLQSALALQRAAYHAHPVPTYAERVDDLKRLRAFLLENQAAIEAAISADYGHRSPHETRLAELVPAVDGIKHTLKHLKRWMKPQRRHADWISFPLAKNRVIPQPLGVVGAIVPWNFPINLSFVPLSAIFAAGNRAMVKMSENSRRLAALLIEKSPQYFPPEKLQFFDETGGVGVAFSQLPFDHLLFTGSGTTGRLVMAAAAKNLCPVTLELGGKSPAIVADDFPLATAAERILFVKCLNAGQICTTVDHAWVPQGKLEDFVRLAQQLVPRMFPSLDSPDYTSIIDVRSFQRLLGALDEAREKGARIVPLLPGPAFDTATRKIAPHLVLEAPADCELMRREIFGPILPLRGYRTLDEVITAVNAGDRPLAVYPFSHDKAVIQRVLDRVMSGGVSVNDALMHVGQHDLPFGGVGPSGMGQYHGREGFETFSKLRPVFQQAPVSALKFFGPPYGARMDALLKFLIR